MVGPAIGLVLTWAEAHAAAYGLDPDHVARTTPLARIRVWLIGRRERLGQHENSPTPADQDLLDELDRAGSVEAYLAARGETP